MVIRGSYYRSGDSVLFQAEVMDVASGRVLKSFDPVGAPVERATVALEALRERIAGGLSPLVNVLNRGNPVDPDLVLPPSLAAYREFVAGLNARKLDDWEEESEHYRRAARLDSTFVAPLIQLAYRAGLNDECSVTDSIGVVLEPRRPRLSLWNRHDHRLGARSLPGGDGEGIAASRAALYRVSQVERRAGPLRVVAPILQPTEGRAGDSAPDGSRARPGLVEFARRGLASVLVANGRDLAHGGRISGRAGHHRSLARFGKRAVADGAGTCAQCPRSRARGDGPLAEYDARLGGPGRRAPTDDRRRAGGARARGDRDGGCREHSRAARAPAGHRLGARAEYRLGESAARPAGAASGRRSSGLSGAMPTRWPSWKRWAGSRCCSPTRPRRTGSTASWPQESNRPLRSPQVRGQQILARAHIAAGFGRREQAVALLREASARGLLELGPSHAFHADPLLAPLRGYPPFDALLIPDN